MGTSGFMNALILWKIRIMFVLTFSKIIFTERKQVRDSLDG